MPQRLLLLYYKADDYVHMIGWVESRTFCDQSNAAMTSSLPDHAKMCPGCLRKYENFEFIQKYDVISVMDKLEKLIGTSTGDL